MRLTEQLVRSFLGLFLPLFCVVNLETSTGLMPAAGEHVAYHAWCRACCADHLFRFVFARAEAQRVYGTARKSNNESTRNTLKHFTCSHKW